MKRTKRIIAALCLALCACAALAAETKDWKKVLAVMDALGSFKETDFAAEVTIVSVKPGEDDTTYVVRYFRRDKDEKFTMVMLKPDTQKGQGYFSVGDDLWFYDPESRKFAFSSLKDSFQDSDAQNSDFSTSSYEKDYDVTESSETKLGNFEVYQLTLVANSKSVPVAKRKVWIRKDNYLPLKEEHYSVSDRLMRTIAIPKYQTVSGRFVPVTELIVDNLKKGEKTQLTLANVSITKLPDAVFTKEYLERVNK
ncbi:MAG TPA: outer membrane lipoprotein-sorting protein [Treponemataceae bacterium]|nr:outer membrane lipoprotein-sorting protein [Treponemataceae bacterium]